MQMVSPFTYPHSLLNVDTLLSIWGEQFLVIRQKWD